MGGTVNAYSGPERPDIEVATIRMSPTLHVPAAMLAKIDDIKLGDELRSYPQAVKTLPGTHRIELRCQLYGEHAFPAFTATVQAGKTYQVNCDDLGDPEHPMITPL